MKTEFKILLRSISSYVMIFSGAMILLWFVFIIITSIWDLNIFTGSSMDLLLFIIFLGLVVIAVAAVINISLSIDLIAEVKIKELNLPNKVADIGGRIIGLALGVVGVLVMVAWIGNSIVRNINLKEFQSITKEVVEANRGSLEKVFDYLADSAQILNTRNVITTVNRSSKEISRTDVILQKEVQGKENFLTFSAGSDSAHLVNRRFENFVIIPSRQEKKLIVSMLTGEERNAQVLQSDDGIMIGYCPISFNGETMVVKLSAWSKNKGRGR